jgi:hypothetical protein
MPQTRTVHTRKIAVTKKPAATARTLAGTTAQRRALSTEQVNLIEMLDETMARLDSGIAKERSALDALLSR